MFSTGECRPQSGREGTWGSPRVSRLEHLSDSSFLGQGIAFGQKIGVDWKEHGKSDQGLRQRKNKSA